jgi:hypothetical protein
LKNLLIENDLEKTLKRKKSNVSVRSFASGRNSVDVILKNDLPDNKETTLQEDIKNQTKKDQKKIKQKESKGKF